MSNDTICAISTAPGVGGIAVVRVSGPDSVRIVNKLWRGKDLDTLAPRTAHLGDIADSRSEILDTALVTVFRGPASFTGEDVVEISVHGSKWVQKEIITSLIGAGCRLAEPGEFTRRAYASGRIGLTEAEGIADLIASQSRAAHRLAISQMRGGLSKRLAELREKLLELSSLLELELDFSEEDVEFASRVKLKAIATDTHDEINRLLASFSAATAIRDGIPVAIVGAPNVGKSSLLNALADDDRAIVSDISGTTRDIVEDTIMIGDYRFRLLDTAGIRHTVDPIESLGIQRAMDAADRAFIVIFMHDTTTHEIPWELAESASRAQKRDDGSRFIIVANKIDATSVNDSSITALKEFAESIEEKDKAVPVIPLSAKEGAGVDELRQALAAMGAEAAGQSDILITNERHRIALDSAAGALAAVINGIDNNLSGDFIAQDLRQALHHIGEITGAVTPADILASIFSRFCIGK